MHTVETVIRTGQDQKRHELKMLFGTGRFTNDPPAVRDLDSGKKVISSQKGHRFAIAFNNGKNKEATFYGVEAWDRTAELIADLAFKGQLVEVMGRVKTDTWKDEATGEDRTADTIVIERFDVKEYKPRAEGEAAQAAPAASNHTNANTALDSAGPIVVSDDDLPF